VIEAASGINLARMGAASKWEQGSSLTSFSVHRDYAGVILFAARQSTRIRLRTRSGDRPIASEVSPRRICSEVAQSRAHPAVAGSYARRFHEEFFATQPVPTAHVLRKGEASALYISSAFLQLCMD